MECERTALARGLCSIHYHRHLRKGSLPPLLGPERQRSFWDFVDTAGDCWIWTGDQDSKGYGIWRVKGKERTGAHRKIWTLLVGPIPLGYDIDHRCFTPLCVNPDHLEPVTRLVNRQRARSHNNSRKTHCPKGHPYNQENTLIRTGPQGQNWRACRRCRHPSKEY